MGPSKQMLRVKAAPVLRGTTSTPRLMLDVIVALVPSVALATYHFGLSAVLVLLTASLTAAVTEYVLMGRGSLHDGSAILTGLLFGLTLPPPVPLWVAAVGSVVAIGLGKLVWGGLGNNLFNPALVGRAFVQAAFPTALTTWAAPGQAFWTLHGSTLAPPFQRPVVDVVSSATPLALMKFEQVSTPWSPLMVGDIGGSLGETSAVAVALGWLYLALRRTCDSRIPWSILLTVGVLAGALHWVNPERYPGPFFMVLSGGLMFGAVFMATDPVTSPTTRRGVLIFGVGVGTLVVLIRVFGGLPEGVMYAILLMNAAAPLIERYTQPRPFGRRSKA